MPRQLEQTPRCCNKAFVGFPRVSGSDSCLPEEAHSTGLPTSPRERCCTAASKVFLRAKKLWVNPPKAERAKPSLSSDYNLLFKKKSAKAHLTFTRRTAFEGDNLEARPEIQSLNGLLYNASHSARIVRNSFRLLALPESGNGRYFFNVRIADAFIPKSRCCVLRTSVMPLFGSPLDDLHDANKTFPQSEPSQAFGLPNTA